MSKTHRQACTACFRSFMLFRSEHQCELCGESVCRKCLSSSGCGSKFRSWRRSRSVFAMKVCKLCDQGSLCSIREEAPLTSSEPLETWHCSQRESPPTQRATTPFIRSHAYSVPPSNSDLQETLRHDFIHTNNLPFGMKFDGSRDTQSLPVVEDQERIVSVDTNDMTKTSPDALSPMFLCRINSSIGKQREILRWMQRAAENRRLSMKRA